MLCSIIPGAVWGRFSVVYIHQGLQYRCSISLLSAPSTPEGATCVSLLDLKPSCGTLPGNFPGSPVTPVLGTVDWCYVPGAEWWQYLWYTLYRGFSIQDQRLGRRGFGTDMGYLAHASEQGMRHPGFLWVVPGVVPGAVPLSRQPDPGGPEHSEHSEPGKPCLVGLLSVVPWDRYP